MWVLGGCCPYVSIIIGNCQFRLFLHMLLLTRARFATACMHAQVLVDMSCGSGLFSRRFVRSGRFKGVVAADFSESMLSQAREFFSTDAALDPRFACEL